MTHKLLTRTESLRIFLEAGLSESTFSRRVRDGLIEKRGTLYPRYQVIASARGEKPKIEEPIEIQFTKVLPSEMPLMIPVLESVFAGSPNVERWQSWIKRNPDIAYMLKINNKVVGCGLVVPLAEEKILNILSQQVTPPTSPDEILLYKPSTPVNLYIRSVGILATATHTQKRRWAAILVRGFFKVIIDLGASGIIINKIYSRSETADGNRILRKMGFTQIPSITNHKNYVIDTHTSGIEIIEAYKKSLIEWKNKHSGEGE